MTASIRHAASNASPPFTRIPYSAPLPVPTMIEVGVASPSAHGHAITMTAVNAMSATVSVDPSTTYQTMKVSIAEIITAGTNHIEIRSAKSWIGAFDPCASSMSRTIFARIVSLPTRVASNSKLPTVFTVPPTTISPIFFSTGILSPVIMDSSTDEDPLMIFPSTAIFSPGRTMTTSPCTTESTAISKVFPSRTTRAVFAASPMSFRIASDVFPFVRASSHFPNRTKVTRNAAVSK